MYATQHIVYNVPHAFTACTDALADTRVTSDSVATHWLVLVRPCPESIAVSGSLHCPATEVQPKEVLARSNTYFGKVNNLCSLPRRLLTPESGVVCSKDLTEITPLAGPTDSRCQRWKFSQAAGHQYKVKALEAPM